MSDTTTTIAQLKDAVNAFIREREWQQFHTPKNLSMVISAEAAELLEKFRWCESQESFQIAEQDRQEVCNELADIIIAALTFANATGIDVHEAITHKLAHNAEKYPIEKSKGRSNKYTSL